MAQVAAENEALAVAWMRNTVPDFALWFSKISEKKKNVLGLSPTPAMNMQRCVIG